MAVLAAAGFALGLWKLFALKFEAGEVYPDYSTLNTGPLGGKAFYAALERHGSPQVERNFLPLRQFKEASGAALVFTGAGRAFFGEDTEENFEFFEGLMRQGLHIVAAMHPRSMPSFAYKEPSTKNPWSFAQGGRKSLFTPGEEDGEEELQHVLAAERWGFAFKAAHVLEKIPEKGYALAPAASNSGLPAALPRWHSPWRWTELSGEWQPLAEDAHGPAIIRRPFGQGSLTLLSDSTFLSNEGLARAPQAEFLLWMLNGSPRAIFDETTHGTSSSPGIMHLAARYRLLGFFAGALAVLALFVWRASTSLVPPHESIESTQSGVIVGAEGASGFANLLRQSIPAQRLLRTCFHEWAKSPLIRRRHSDEAVTAVRDAIAAAEAGKKPDPAAVCREIHHTLATLRKG